MDIQEARAKVMNDARKGTTCPCCDQHVKIYKRKLNSGIARIMIAFFKASRSLPDADGWLHPAGLGVSARDALFKGTDYSILKYWGLLERHPEKRGLWRLTSLAEDFIHNRVTVPRYVYTMNNKLVVIEGEEDSELHTDIRTALGDHFDYDELMAPLVMKEAS